MDPSFQGESVLAETIASRIRAAVRNLADAKEQIKKEGIKGDTDDSLKRLLVGIVEKIEAQIEFILQEIKEIRKDEVKRGRSDRVHRALEGFLFDVDLIRTTTLQIPTELCYLTKAALRKLGHEDIKVVLIPEASLGTTNLSDSLKSLSEFFEDVLDYIDSDFPFYWIIFVPPSLIRTPLNWPLVVHEIGHILERQKWQLVGKYYEYPIVPSLFDRDMKSYYAQEFQADFVAVSYFGPIFVRRLFAVYDTGEFKISLTHPPRRERFGAIAETLEQMGFSSEANDIRKKIEKEKVTIGSGPIEYLNDIRSETVGKLNESSCVYSRDDAEERKARNRLDRFAVYTDDVRTLLNVADSVLQGKLQSVSDPTEKRNTERDFDYLLVDSIRLHYIKGLVQPASLNSSSPLS